MLPVRAMKNVLEDYKTGILELEATKLERLKLSNVWSYLSLQTNSPFRVLAQRSTCRISGIPDDDIFLASVSGMAEMVL